MTDAGKHLDYIVGTENYNKELEKYIKQQNGSGLAQLKRDIQKQKALRLNIGIDINEKNEIIFTGSGTWKYVGMEIGDRVGVAWNVLSDESIQLSEERVNQLNQAISNANSNNINFEYQDITPEELRLLSIVDPNGLKDYINHQELVNYISSDAVLDLIQMGLDIGGLVPVIGEPLDGINAGIYLVRGDELNAALSGASMVPIVGWASSGGKLVKKSINYVDYVDEAAEIIAKGNKANSKILRNNLIEAGIKVPNYPNAAHHIVAATSPKAAEARAILQKYGIDINDAANGVFLPTVKDVSNSAYHPSLHTDAYYEEVTDLLASASSRQDVLDILDDIGEQLLNGTFMK